MAWAFLPAPGSKNDRGEEIGPCVDERCGHADCAQTRAMAGKVCGFCNEPIGYGRGFFAVDGNVLEHSACRMQYEEEQREDVER